MLVLAKDETLKHSPTKKVVVLGSVAEQATSGGSASATDYSLQWEQVGGEKCMRFARGGVARRSPHDVGCSSSRTMYAQIF